MAMGLRLLERTGDGLGSPASDAEQGEGDCLLHKVPAVGIVFDHRSPEFPGTLYVYNRVIWLERNKRVLEGWTKRSWEVVNFNEFLLAVSVHRAFCNRRLGLVCLNWRPFLQQVVWRSDIDMSKGYAVDFLSMSLHAISTDPESYPSPCLYVQIDTGDDEESDNSESELHGEESENLDLAAVREMRLVPSNPDELETLFVICCECAKFNSEPTEDEEEGNNWIFSPDQLEEMPGLWGAGDDEEQISADSAKSIGHSIGAHDQLARTVLQLEINDQRFEDAEEMELEKK